jgi:hypothetical protein
VIHEINGPRAGSKPYDRPIIRHPALAPAAILAALVLAAPWPFGSVPFWAAACLASGAAIGLAVALLAIRRTALLRTVAVPAGALLALALLGLLQSFAWPAGWVVHLSPEHARLVRQAEEAAHPQPASRATAPEAIALSLAPATTRRTALLFAGLAAALAAGAEVGRWRLARRLVGGALVAAALGEILYGIPRWFARSRTMWGVEVPGSDRLRGTFVNPNHMAEYLEIALAVAFAWTWWAVTRATREGSAERRVALVAPPVLVWLTLFTGLAFTGSRAGLLAAAVATAIQGVLVPGRRRARRRSALWGLAGLAVVALGVVAVLATGPEQGFGRLLGTSAQDVGWTLRLEVYHRALGLWKLFPWLGSGLGTFLDAFPMVQPPNALDLTWWHAHSDPLELLVTAGAIGAAFAAVGLAGLLFRVLVRGHRTEDRAAALAALGALVAVGLHEWVDFGLTMAANSFTLALVTGCAAGAALASRRPAADSPAPARPGPRRPPPESPPPGDGPPA